MTAGTVDNTDVVELDCEEVRGAVSAELGCGDRSVIAGDSGRDDDEHATASASTCRMPSSDSVHLSWLASTYRGMSICPAHTFRNKSI